LSLLGEGAGAPFPSCSWMCRLWPAPIDLGEIRNTISPLRQWIVARQGQDRARAWGAKRVEPRCRAAAGARP
jgi:hypothetical protein